MEKLDKHLLLLGYPSAPEQEAEIVGLLDSLDPMERALAYNWGMFSFYDLVEMANEQAINYRRQDPDRSSEAAQAAASGFINDIQSWLKMVKTKEKVPMLIPQPPADMVGEPFDWLVWSVEEGGAANQLVLEQTEYLDSALENCKAWIRGETKFLMHPDSVMAHLPQETSAERRAREAEELRQAASRLLEILSPSIEATAKLLEDLGEDPALMLGLS